MSIRSVRLLPPPQKPQEGRASSHTVCPGPPTLNHLPQLRSLPLLGAPKDMGLKLASPFTVEALGAPSTLGFNGQPLPILETTGNGVPPTILIASQKAGFSGDPMPYSLCSRAPPTLAKSPTILETKGSQTPSLSVHRELGPSHKPKVSQHSRELPTKWSLNDLLIFPPSSQPSGP